MWSSGRDCQSHQRQCNVVGFVLRAALKRDANGLLEGFKTFNPGEEEQMVCVVFLSKWIDELQQLKRPNVANLSVEAQIFATKKLSPS